jgi:2,4-dienoyl-CoA reductase-like NADH-dependent reductase (Old Yellow Enzyme family)
MTQLARTVAQIPVIANGGMHDPQLAEQVISDGHADLSALARGALANPDWPQRLTEGLRPASFDHTVLHPVATIENARRWLMAQKRL